ncbi:MAG: type IV pilus assembly protein PilM [Patescibacteria group bacterium]
MDFFGLDMGSHNLKAVEFKKRGEEFHLVSLGSIPSTPKGIFSEAETDLNALSEAVKKLLDEAKVSSKNVSAALPQDKVFTRTITMPFLKDDELNSAIKWEIEQYVPIPVEEVEIAHQVVGKLKIEEQEKIQVLIVAAPKKLIEKTLKVLKSASLNPLGLETEIIAIARSLVPPVSDAILVVDLGAKATDMAIVENGSVVFSRSIPTAGEALTRAVSSSFNLDSSQAESYKKAYGVDKTKLEGKVGAVINPILTSIISEVEKTVQYFQTQTKKETKRIILSGGTAGLPEVVSLMASQLNMEVQVGDPFRQIKMDDEMKQALSKVYPSVFAVAAGLAMKDID